MSFSEQLGAGIAAAHTSHQLDELSKAVAAAWGAGSLDDDAAGAALEALAARRRELGDHRAPSRRPFSVLRRSPGPRSPDRVRSKFRRRRIAASGMLPPDMAEVFTPGQLAALSIVAELCAEHGQCDLCVDAIGARAGVCARMVQTAQRLAESFGWLSIQARPRPGRKSLPNVLRVISKKWLAWLGVASRHRVKNSASHGKSKININLTASGNGTHWPRRTATASFWGSAKEGGRKAPPESVRHAGLQAALAKAEALLRR